MKCEPLQTSQNKAKDGALDCHEGRTRTEDHDDYSASGCKKREGLSEVFQCRAWMTPSFDPYKADYFLAQKAGYPTWQTQTISKIV